MQGTRRRERKPKPIAIDETGSTPTQCCWVALMAGRPPHTGILDWGKEEEAEGKKQVTKAR
jgi:hypothetical protein